MKIEIPERCDAKWIREWRDGNLFLDAMRANYTFPLQVNEVWFGDNQIYISFSFKNSRGLIFPDNGYFGRTDNGLDYYPLIRVSCQHSQECRFNPTCKPNLEAVANGIKEAWLKFIS